MVTLIFAVGLVSEFESLGIDTSNFMKNSDGTKAFTHIENIKDYPNNFVFANENNVKICLDGEVVDVYNSFEELAKNEIEYRIENVNRNSNTSVIAIHGGGIEVGSTQLANKLAELGVYNYYSFRSSKKTNNRILHITSANFDEPICVSMVEKSDIVISLHGYAENISNTYIGGLDTELGNAIKESLETAGFVVSSGRYAGDDITNICNKCTTGKGVQLELSTALRQEMLNNNSVLSAYAQAIKEVL